MSEQKKDKISEVRIHIALPKEMLDRVDEYWHANKLRSRADAIRHMIDKCTRE